MYIYKCCFNNNIFKATSPLDFAHFLSFLNLKLNTERRKYYAYVINLNNFLSVKSNFVHNLKHTLTPPHPHTQKHSTRSKKCVKATNNRFCRTVKRYTAVMCSCF